jgi:hypothetical protein
VLLILKLVPKEKEKMGVKIFSDSA